MQGFREVTSISIILDDARVIIAQANRFYQSFDASTCPATMLDELTLQATRDLISFYPAHLDDHGKLNWFAKIVRIRSADGEVSETIGFHESYVYTVEGAPGLRRLIREDGLSASWSLSPGRLVDMMRPTKRHDAGDYGSTSLDARGQLKAQWYFIDFPPRMRPTTIT